MTEKNDSAVDDGEMDLEQKQEAISISCGSAGVDDVVAGLTTKRKKAFRIDTDRIASVPVSEQNAELRDLNLHVYNHDTFEEGPTIACHRLTAHSPRTNFLHFIRS